MELIAYPHLNCPFPSAINPYAREAQQATVAWARQLRLLQRDKAYLRLNRLQNGMLIARAYPMAGPETLQIVTDWSTWLFLMDDQCDEAGIGHDPERLMQLHKEFLTILEGTPPAQNAAPLVHGLWDLHTRILAYAPEGWQGRFIHSVKQYFTANIWEATNRRQHEIPDVEAYCTMRRFTSAVYPCLLLIELTEGLRLPAEVCDHPDVQRLTSITNNAVAWANDIVSLEKEFRQGDVHNLALILYHKHKLSLQAAINQVGALHDAEVYAFIDLAKQLPSFTPTVDADLQRYVSGLRFWMRANLDWSLDTTRYQSLPVSSAQPVLA